jgi:hypothetical protein
LAQNLTDVVADGGGVDRLGLFDVVGVVAGGGRVGATRLSLSLTQSSRLSRGPTHSRTLL